MHRGFWITLYDVHYEVITMSDLTGLVVWLVCNLQTKYRFLLTAKIKNHITNYLLLSEIQSLEIKHLGMFQAKKKHEVVSECQIFGLYNLIEFQKKSNMRRSEFTDFDLKLFRRKFYLVSWIFILIPRHVLDIHMYRERDMQRYSQNSYKHLTWRALQQK